MNNCALKISSILRWNHNRSIIIDIKKIQSRIMSQTYQHSNYCNNHSINNSLNHDNKIINAIVVCGPSGSGKTTLLNLLFEHFKDKLKFSISHTTRKSRPNEVNGNYYGTSIQELITNEKSGLLSVLDVDLRGVINLQKKDILKAKYIFVKPPSLQFLEMNLRNRGTENDDSISVRLKHAAEDLKQAETIHFDLILENFVLKNSFEKLRQFVQSELTRFNESHRHRE
ncbi:uncharacterized protein LOC124493630 isoform X3 [Dermatophagoides farinae]|uniref:uncharacterized protein LOC124493630 isoform X3 n=1 Tax=Dermatophagoides farinae TaxID=6954 RepID=UPI003F5F414A